MNKLPVHIILVIFLISCSGSRIVIKEIKYKYIDKSESEYFIDIIDGISEVNSSKFMFWSSSSDTKGSNVINCKFPLQESGVIKVGVVDNGIFIGVECRSSPVVAGLSYNVSFMESKMVDNVNQIRNFSQTVYLIKPGIAQQGDAPEPASPAR